MSFFLPDSWFQPLLSGFIVAQIQSGQHFGSRPDLYQSHSMFCISSSNYLPFTEVTSVLVATLPLNESQIWHMNMTESHVSLRHGQISDITSNDLSIFRHFPNLMSVNNSHLLPALDWWNRNLPDWFPGNLRNFKLVDMMEILRDSFYLNDKNCKTLLISRCFLTKDCFLIWLLLIHVLCILISSYEF